MDVPLQSDPNERFSARPVYNMAMPFNPNTILPNALMHGMNRRQASFFAHLALEQFRELHKNQPAGRPVTAVQVAEAIKVAAAQKLADRQSATQEFLREQGIQVGTIAGQMEYEVQKAGGEIQARDQLDIETVKVLGQKRYKWKFTQKGLDDWFHGSEPYALHQSMEKLSLMDDKRDIITALCSNIELAVELGKQLDPKDIVSLYSANRAFHNAIKGHLLSSVRMWIAYNAPEAGEVFPFRMYRNYLVYDPARRTYGEMCEGMPESLKPHPHKRDQVRIIPGLRYLQLVIGRDRYCDEILAIMARNGHRMPPTMKRTLLKLWVLMEVSTSAQRQSLMAREDNWTDEDLYNAQMLFMKLGLHFNDPVYGPCSYELLHVVMGQRGLYPLWQLLMNKKYTTLHEIVEARVRYDFRLPADHWGHDYFDKTIYGVPYADVGIGHCEGWGKGVKHLLRPDELVPVEATKRGLELNKHLMMMVIWGYFDWQTGENLVPSEEEIYIEDEDDKLHNVDTTCHWRRKHCLKKRWQDLSEDVRREMIEDDEDEHLRALAWSVGVNDFEDSDDEVSSIGDHDPDGFGPFDGDLDEEDMEEDANDAPQQVTSGDDGNSDEEQDTKNPNHGRIDGRTFAESYDPNDEISRGWQLRPRAKDQPSEVPSLGDASGWVDFVNSAIIGIPVDVDEDERLKAQAIIHYEALDADLDADLDAGEWDKELSEMDSNWRQFQGARSLPTDADFARAEARLADMFPDGHPAGSHRGALDGDADYDGQDDSHDDDADDDSDVD